MIPIYRLEVDGEDVTGNFSDRSIKIAVTLRDGEESDDFSIEVDDRDYAVELPARGSIVKIWLGYMETGLEYMGAFECDGSNLSGPPRSMSVRGRAAGMRSSTKEHRTEKYEDMTIKDIVGKMAKRHNLTPIILGKVGDKKIKRLDQVLRSDLHTLTKLARENGATFRIGDRSMVFAEKGSSPAPDIILNEQDLIDYTFDIEDRPRSKAVKARYYDKKKGEEVIEEAAGGVGEAVHWLRDLYQTKDQAKSAAESQMGNLKSNESTMSVTISGRPAYDAGARVIINLRDGTRGPWLADEVSHTLDSGGLVTILSGKSENGESE